MKSKPLKRGPIHPCFNKSSRLLSLFTDHPFWWSQPCHHHGWNQLISSDTTRTSCFSDLCAPCPFSLPVPCPGPSVLSFESYRVWRKHLQVPLSKTNQAISRRGTEEKMLPEPISSLESIHGRLLLTVPLQQLMQSPSPPLQKGINHLSHGSHQKRANDNWGYAS